MVRTILPDILGLTTEEVGLGRVRVNTWPTDPVQERRDLSIPFAGCGTGIRQVLSIPYIAMEANSPQILLIDEPQSFLHPGALRKLIDVLKYEQRHNHQYIVSTHSPQLISDTASASLYLITKRDSASRVERLSPGEADHKKLLLTDLGIQMSDVLTAERILWVEGPTEASAFPLIIGASDLFGDTSISMIGASILPLSATGDPEGRNMDAAATIYEAVTAGISFVPPALAFIIDSELRTEEQKERVERTFHHRVYWLKRRMYENYLLHPEALSKPMLDFPDTPQTDATPEAIQQRLQELLASRNFYHGGAPDQQ